MVVFSHISSNNELAYTEEVVSLKNRCRDNHLQLNVGKMKKLIVDFCRKWECSHHIMVLPRTLKPCREWSKQPNTAPDLLCPPCKSSSSGAAGPEQSRSSRIHSIPTITSLMKRDSSGSFFLTSGCLIRTCLTSVNTPTIYYKSPSICHFVTTMSLYNTTYSRSYFLPVHRLYLMTLPFHFYFSHLHCVTTCV